MLWKRLSLPFRSTSLHLQDILRSIRLIESFLDGVSYEQYAADAKTQAAVERHLQIITEAAYRLGDEAGAICPGPDWVAYRGMGNILRHAYRRVQDEVVWETAIVDLPNLKRDVEIALANPIRES
jgi:uncharacterized protein with HEPN domain